MSDQTGLFSGAMPLAARMRPTSLEELVGQGHLLKPGSPLQALATKAIPGERSSSVSVILWGPAGTGKTTIAQLVARLSGRRFVELSAITAGVKDVREVMERARADRDAYGVNTVLFLDEIHRFSKAQQDALLPGVENGWIVLIAATTENPSFSVISPLLSRSLLLTLTLISDADLVTVLKRAVLAPQGLAGAISADEDVLAQIALVSGGDARRALTILEAAATVAIGNAPISASNSTTAVLEEHVSAAMDRALVRYDKDGDQHYDVISAFIKSVRGSDADAAVHYLARMIEAGEDPRFIARRLIILAAEDIGLADPHALPLAVAAAEAVAMIGMPEGRIPLAEATIYLCLAPKSNSAYNAINQAIEDVRAGLFGEVPKPLRSSNHAGAKGAGAGVGYLYPHDDPKAVVPQRYLDDKTLNRSYFKPKDIGVERELVERWAKLRGIIRSFKK
ncbi:replication-associated recombination protein A [Rhodoluna lacicola]|uniref:ATPase related to the helicase subunit of the Holliday junction resolvase n=1 Tax=Rhodoluna lacicola TaxID=529884 RepID=A0A060JG35_9MICO|nr:replication-associated recombination protein A [Rhodoluna lacicola]AIC47527.1 ATPase related to the helicase subunit of the Holliday junction resolvase [Rhodoluna lacicola]